jgi:ketosteroid isomerase-like protein
MTNVELIRSVYAAYERRDFAYVFARVGSDLEIVQTTDLPWGGVHRGVEGAQAFFAKIAEHVDALPHAETLIPAGDDVAVVGRLRGKAKKSGAEIDIPIVHVWTVRDGKFVKFQAWIDTPTMRAAIEE